MAEGLRGSSFPRLNIGSSPRRSWSRCDSRGPGARIERLVKAVLARIEAEIAL